MILDDATEGLSFSNLFLPVTLQTIIHGSRPQTELSDIPKTLLPGSINSQKKFALPINANASSFILSPLNLGDDGSKWVRTSHELPKSGPQRVGEAIEDNLVEPSGKSIPTLSSVASGVGVQMSNGRRVVGCQEHSLGRPSTLPEDVK